MNKNISGRKGGASIFLCIILSAVILTEGVLYFAARIRGYEADIYRCMRLQISQILCNYNQALLEKYGLYGLDKSSLNTQVFDTCFSDKNQAVLSVSVCEQMTISELRTGITDYMQVRMPSIAASELLSRLKGVVGQINESELFQKATGSQSSEWLGYVQDFLGQKDKWSDIINIAAAAAEVVDISGKLNDLEEFSSSFQKTMERGSTLFLQGEAETDFSKDLFNPDNLAGIIGYVDNYLNYDAPDIIDGMMINEYAVSFFDSKIEFFRDSDSKVPETNLLGVAFSDIHSTNRADLEYILTGIDNEVASFGVAKVLILDTRILVNFGTFLLDTEKMNKAKEIAEILSAAISAASLGTVTVDPDILQFVVLYVWALGQAYSDVFSLAEGKSVLLFNHKVISDQRVLKDALMTNYRDYVGLFLFAIPEEWKLSRMLSVLKKDCGSEIYTGVNLCADFRGRRFFMEDTFDAYVSA